MSGLGFTPPRPGSGRLSRRVGDYGRFVDDLIGRLTAADVGGQPLGRRWDVASDPNAVLLIRLWAYVAEGVAAYSELTANEGYSQTAADWSDLRRIAAMVGYRPRPRVAAVGWVRVAVDPAAAPVIPAGTRVQASATAQWPAQQFEVSASADLRADWGGLTATAAAVPEPTSGSTVRLLGGLPYPVGTQLVLLSPDPEDSAGALKLFGLLRVLRSRSELGTTLLTLDRDVTGRFGLGAATGLVYRLVASAGPARRLESVLQFPATGGGPTATALSYQGEAAIAADHVILDRLVNVSADQQAVLVSSGQSSVQQRRVDGVSVVAFEVAPGTFAQLTRLSFASEPLDPVPDSSLMVHVVADGAPAVNVTLPALAPGVSFVRIHPAPAVVPDRLALRTGPGDTWETFACRTAPDAMLLGGEEALVLALDHGPAGTTPRAPADANLVLVRHGNTRTAVLGSGDPSTDNQQFTVPGAPIAYDTAADGAITPSLQVRVDGVRWAEVPTLYGVGRAQVFETTLTPDGGIIVRFGDGRSGDKPGPGVGNITAAYRIGGGTAGELPAGAINGLLGSIHGVRKVEGAGPTTGGADQDAPEELRARSAGVVRTCGRLVSLADAAELARAYPGVSHAAAWAGPAPGCPCGMADPHVAVLRKSGQGFRAAVDSEVQAVSRYLDGRRDPGSRLCVVSGTVTPVAVTARLVLDPRRVPADVVAAVRAALLGTPSLTGADRLMGQPLDRSDVVAVIHGVPGVLGAVDVAAGRQPPQAPAPSASAGQVPAGPGELLTVSAVELSLEAG